MLTSNDMSLFLLKYIKYIDIIYHNHSSFNEFVSKKGLKNIICNIFKIQDILIFDKENTHFYNNIEISKMIYVLKFIDVRFEEPKYVNQVSNDTELLTPHIARLKNLTYASEIIIDCEISIDFYHKQSNNIDTKKVIVKDLYIGKYPIMVKSNMCNINKATKQELINVYKEDPNDTGGYFIIGGVEWTIDTLESILYNSFRVYNNHYNNEVSRGEFISKPGDGFEISREIILRLNNNDLITLQLVGNHDIFEDFQIPFYLIFRLYGIMSDLEIFKFILFDFEKDTYYDKIKFFIESSLNNNDKSTKFDKLANIYDHTKLLIEFGKIIFKNKKLDDMVLLHSVNTLIDKSFLLHIGDDSSDLTRKKKLVYFGILIRKLILVNQEILPVTDRDSYSTKRLHSAGISYAKTFKKVFRATVINSIKKTIKTAFTQTGEKSTINLVNLLSKISNYGKLADAVEKSIKTGNKEITYDKASKPIINRISSQMLNRKNHLNTLSTLRVINTQNTSSSNQTNRAIEMRSVHPTYVGYICPTATADTGEKVGLSKQLAISALITIASDSELIKKTIANKIISIDSIIDNDSLDFLKKYTQVYVNGDLQGCIDDTYGFLKDIRHLRLLKEIDIFTTIYFNLLLDEIHIWVDYGRVVRPLIKVYNNFHDVDNPNFKFHQYIKLTSDHISKLNSDEISIIDLENEHIIEYISAEEQENCFLAYNIDEFYNNQDNITKPYTHVDIEEALFGITALTSPFLNHTMSQRGSYQTNQAKQSCGWYTLNPHDRYDKKKFYQTYCETPIVKTITSHLTYPNGTNLMLAMMTLG